jgi:hypothetical protein
MGELEAWDEETLSKKCTHIRDNKKQVRCGGESELNTARNKNMAQGESKDQEL